MVIRVFYIVVSIFSVAMVYLTIEKPYYAELFRSNEVVANMQMSAVTDYEINATMVSARYEADEWKKYSEFDEFVKFGGKILRGEKEHNISSNMAYYNQGRITFRGDVEYANNEGLQLFSDEIIYRTTTKVATSEVPFVMMQNEDTVMGNALVYDFELKKAYIKKARAWINEDRKNKKEEKK